MLAVEQLPPIHDPLADPDGPGGGFDLSDAGRFMEPDVSLCWIYVHMIEEYARRNGHADLLCGPRRRAPVRIRRRVTPAG
jgi:hypothetical protein